MRMVLSVVVVRIWIMARIVVSMLRGMGTKLAVLIIIILGGSIMVAWINIPPLNILRLVLNMSPDATTLTRTLTNLVTERIGVVVAI